MSAILTDDMLALLSTMKGKTLRSLEYNQLRSGCGRGQTWGLMQINLARAAVRVRCERRVMEYFGENEDPAVLECSEADPSKIMMPYSERWRGYSYHVRRYLVGERVTGVEVVREHVTDIEPGESFGGTFDMDVTIAIRTPWRTVSVSRGAPFDEILDMRHDDPCDVDAASIQPVEVTWFQRDYYRTLTAVEREVIVL